MNFNATIDAETKSLPDFVTAVPQRDATPANSIENWLQGHLQMLALAVTAAGFGARIFTAGRFYLNPDEALQYVQLNQHSALLAYEVGRSLPHPPLYYLLLYYWHLLGRSELMLRLPSVLLGTALCWVAFKWVGNLFGRTAGLVALVLLTFCPTLIALSGEIRQYALLLFCMVTALYFVGQAFQRNSAGQMWCFSAFLYLAILSHYSAFFFVLSVGLYSMARIADLRPPRKVATAWVLGQMGAIAIYVFLYVTQLSKLRANLSAWGGDLDQSYFHSY